MNKASIKLTLDHLPKGSDVIIDATKSQYIDFDVLELIREFKEIKAPQKEINCMLIGFKEKYKIENTHNVQSEKIGTLNIPGVSTSVKEFSTSNS